MAAALPVSRHGYLFSLQDFAGRLPLLRELRWLCEIFFVDFRTIYSKDYGEFYDAHTNATPSRSWWFSIPNLYSHVCRREVSMEIAF